MACISQKMCSNQPDVMVANALLRIEHGPSCSEHGRVRCLMMQLSMQGNERILLSCSQDGIIKAWK